MSRSTTSRRRVVALAGSGAIVVAGSGAALLAPVEAGAAATFTVDTVNDSGPGSLRAAIDAANGAGGHDLIEFSPSLTGTITLASDLPAITEEVSIHGNGVVVIDGGWRDGGASGYSVLAFSGVSGSVDIANVDITGGHRSGGPSTSKGGAIWVGGGSSADVTVSDSYLHGNLADMGSGAMFVDSTGATVNVLRSKIVDNVAAVGGGGGLYIEAASLLIDHTAFVRNSALSEGGGLYLSLGDGAAVITDSEFTGNSCSFEGGAIHLASGDLTISGTTFSGNHSDFGGGALYLDTGTTVIVDSTFSGNTASQSNGGGAIMAAASADLSIVRSTISGNTSGWGGGGVRTTGTGNFAILDSTVSGNSAGYYGGGLYLGSSGTAEILNSTISGNSGRQAGGVFGGKFAGVQVVQSTITDNRAGVPATLPAVGGIQIAGGEPFVAGQPAGVAAPLAPGHLQLSGVIVAGNSGVIVPGVDDDDDLDLGAFGATTVQVESDHSIIGSIQSPNVVVTDLGGTQVWVTTANLALGPLADNGGPTLTHALLAGSPALNAGPAVLSPFEGDAYDQRGAPYVRVYGGIVDIGAYEEQPRPQPEPVPEPTFTG